MNIVLRVDASKKIGTGHVVRCLSLAEELRARSFKCSFISRELDGNLNSVILGAGFHLKVLPKPDTDSINAGRLAHSHWLEVTEEIEIRESITAIEDLDSKPDWVVVDHYGIDEVWESAIRTRSRWIVAIDDLFDRTHNCDVLLDQNFRAEPDNAHCAQVSAKCIRLIGPKYALLRREFHRDPPVRSRLNKAINRSKILVFFGGSDPAGATLKCLNALKKLPTENFEFTVVVGVSNPLRDQIVRECKSLSNFFAMSSTNEFRDLLADHHFYVGSGGSVTLERFRMGLPGIVISVAENQEEISKEAARAGFCSYLGSIEGLDELRLREELFSFFKYPTDWEIMAESAAKLVDGKGCTRVADLIDSISRPRETP